MLPKRRRSHGSDGKVARYFGSAVNQNHAIQLWVVSSASDEFLECHEIFHLERILSVGQNVAKKRGTSEWWMHSKREHTSKTSESFDASFMRI
jgi:hypothetical protein